MIYKWIFLAVLAGYFTGISAFGQEASPLQRTGQLNHLIAMMHEHEYTVPLGIAVQDGIYIGKTGADGNYEKIWIKG